MPLCCTNMKPHMRRPSKFRRGWGGGILKLVFSDQHISQRAARTSLEKQLDPRGPIASREGFVTVCLRQLVIIKGSGTPVRPLVPPMPDTRIKYCLNLNKSENKSIMNKALYLLGILLIARRGRSTRIVRIADKLKFSVSRPYSNVLKNEIINCFISLKETFTTYMYIIACM